MRIIELAVILLLSVAACSDTIGGIASWKFVQSVGGLSIGDPVRDALGWTLPVRANVSGLTKVTVQPTSLNSGIACLETRAMVEGSTIFISIVTGAAGVGRVARCPPAVLGQLAPGRYSVVYRGKDSSQGSVGSIVIAP